MKDIAKFYNDMNSSVSELESCQNQLVEKNGIVTSLRNELNEIDKFKIYKKDIMEYGILLPCCSALIFFIGTVMASVPMAIYMMFVVIAVISIPLFISIADYEDSKKKLLEIGKIKSFSKDELASRKSQIVSEYSKIQEEVKSLEDSVRNLSSKIQIFSVDIFKKIDEEVSKVDAMYADFISEPIDYRNTHLVLNEINKQDKKLVKTYGKNKKI